MSATIDHDDAIATAIRGAGHSVDELTDRLIEATHEIGKHKTLAKSELSRRIALYSVIAHAGQAVKQEPPDIETARATLAVPWGDEAADTISTRLTAFLAAWKEIETLRREHSRLSVRREDRAASYAALDESLTREAETAATYDLFVDDVRAAGRVLSKLIQADMLE